MPSKETARQHRTLAQDQYKRGQYMEAMRSADKALALGYLDLSVYDIKAAALNKLVEPQDGPWRDLGFETIKQMCLKWPRNWRPFYRKAEHLRSRGAFAHALAAIEQSVQLVDSENTALVKRKQTEIQGMREMSLIEQARRLNKGTREEKEVLIKRRRIEANRTKDFTHLLGPDILDLIVDHLLVDSPSVACCIAGVRRSWRDCMLARPGVWQHLVLGAKRPVEKASIFVQRSKGIIYKLILREDFEQKHEAPLSIVLAPHAGNLKSLTFTHHPHQLLQRLAGGFDSIEHLTRLPTRNARTNHGVPASGIDSDFEIDQGLRNRDPTLKSITLSNTHVIFPLAGERDAREVLNISNVGNVGNVGNLGNAGPMAVGAIGIHGRNVGNLTNVGNEGNGGSVGNVLDKDSTKYRSLSNIETLRMTGGSFTSNGNPLLALVRHLPQLVHLCLDEVVMWDTGHSTRQLDTSLYSLVTFSFTTPANNFTPNDTVTEFFRHVSTPDLTTLDLWRYTQDLPTLLRTPNLTNCLSTLSVLDVGKSTINEDGLLDILRQTPALRFLGISCTSLGDSFLEAITRDKKPGSGVGHEELLPQLIALSIAALEITSLALRDFAVSRIPKPAKSRLRPLAPTGTSKPSAFRPSSFLSPVSRPASQAASRPIEQLPTVPKQSQSPRKYLKWLCLDHCEQIDPQLTEYLRTKIMFVSAGKVRNEDRMRGRGQYHWDHDYYDSCLAGDPKERCKLVAIPGTRDGYEIHHTCGKYDHLADDPEEERDNIWESQWNPSSSQDGMEEVQGDKDKGKVQASQGTQESVGQKRQLTTDAGAEGSRAKKGKGKGRISIAPDGSLIGF